MKFHGLTGAAERGCEVRLQPPCFPRHRSAWPLGDKDTGAQPCRHQRSHPLSILHQLTRSVLGGCVDPGHYQITICLHLTQKESFHKRTEFSCPSQDIHATVFKTDSQVRPPQGVSSAETVKLKREKNQREQLQLWVCH